MINLYSYRFSTARGWHWKLERECLESTSKEWLEVFEKSEPDILFRLATKKPRNLKQN